MTEVLALIVIMAITAAADFGLVIAAEVAQSELVAAEEAAQ